MFNKANLSNKKSSSNPMQGKVILASILAGSMFLVGCEGNELVGKQEIEKVLSTYSTHKGVSASNSIPLKSEIIDNSKLPTSEVLSTEGWPTKYITTTKEYKASAKTGEQLLLNPGSDVIYLGSVLRGDSIGNGGYKEITHGTKSQQTASYSLTGDNVKLGRNFKPTLSGFREMHSDIISQKGLKAQSVWNYDEQIITSESEFDMKIVASAGYNGLAASAKLRTGIDLNNKTKKTNYVIRFMQTYYTVNLNQSEDTFLYEKINPIYFNKYRPVYVSSLSYGRLAYMVISTSLSSQELKAALDLAIDAKVATANLETDVNYKKLKTESNTKITVIGDNQVFTKIDEFMNFIKESKFSPENPGIIISYKLRFVDSNEVANVVFAQNYTVRETKAIEGTYSVTLTPYKARTSVSSTGENGAVEYNGKITAFVKKISLSEASASTQESTLWENKTTIGATYPTSGSHNMSGTNRNSSVNERSYILKSDDQLVLDLKSLKELDYSSNDVYELVSNRECQNVKTGLELATMSKTNENWTLCTAQKGYSDEKLDFIFNVKATANYPD